MFKQLQTNHKYIDHYIPACVWKLLNNEIRYFGFQLMLLNVVIEAIKWSENQIQNDKFVELVPQSHERIYNIFQSIPMVIR